MIATGPHLPSDLKKRDIWHVDPLQHYLVQQELKGVSSIRGTHSLLGSALSAPVIS